MRKPTQYTRILIVTLCTILNSALLNAQDSLDINTNTLEIKRIATQLNKTKVDSIGDKEFKLYYKGLEVLKDSTIPDAVRFDFYATFARVFNKIIFPNEAIKNAKKAVFLAEKLGLEKDVSRYSSLWAFSYQRLKQYDSATTVFKKAITYNNLFPPNINALSVHNNLGIHYFENLHNNDSAMVHFKKLYKYPEAIQNKGFLKWSINDNIALVYMSQEKYELAKPLFEDNYKFYGVHYKDAPRLKENWIRAGLQLSDVDIKLGKINQAKALLEEIEQHLTILGDYGSDRQQSDLLFYKVKASYYETIGKYAEANDLLNKRQKLWAEVKEHQFEEESKNHYVYNTIGLEKTKNLLTEETNHRLEEEKFANKLKWFVVFLIISGLTIITLFYLRHRQFKKTKSVEVNLQQEQLKTQALNNTILSKENQAIKTDLANYTQQLIKRNQEKKILTAEYEKLKAHFGEQKDLETLQELAASKILTQDDWESFKEKFNTAYPNYLLSLKNKGYQFTPAERRFIALEKLALSTEQIANMLGVSIDSVRTSRYRLRKKLDAPNTISIIEFLEK